MQDWKDILYEKTKHEPIKFKDIPYWFLNKETNK